MPLCFYTALGDSNAASVCGPSGNDEDEQVTTTPKTNEITAVTKEKNHSEGSTAAAELSFIACEDAVAEACKIICDRLKNCQDKNLVEGMLQFSHRAKKLASSNMHQICNLSVALFNFGTNELKRGKNGKK